MASIHNDIRAALESHLSTTAGLPAIAYENVPFDPTTGTSFLKVMYIPTTRRPAVRGLNPQQRYEGLLSVTVYCPEGNGPSTADDYANLVTEAFEANAAFEEKVRDDLSALTEETWRSCRRLWSHWT